VTGRLRAIWAELSVPSAQRDSWFGWASAQLAHAMIGAALAGGLVFILPPAAALFLVVAFRRPPRQKKKQT